MSTTKKSNSNQVPKQQIMKIKDKKKKENTSPAKKEYTPPSEASLMLMPFVFVLAAFFIILCLFAPSVTGWLGVRVKALLAGLFSWGAYFIPLMLVARAFCHRKEATSRHPYKNWLLSLLFITLFSAIIATVKVQVEGFNVAEHFKSAIDNGHITTGSLLGGLISNGISSIIGRIFTAIILVIAIVFVCPFTVNKTPADLAGFTSKTITDEKARAEERKKRREEYFRQKEAEEAERAKQEKKERREREKKEKKNREGFDINVEGPGEPVADVVPDEIDIDGEEEEE